MQRNLRPPSEGNGALTTGRTALRTTEVCTAPGSETEKVKHLLWIRPLSEDPEADLIILRQQFVGNVDPLHPGFEAVLLLVREISKERVVLQQIRALAHFGVLLSIEPLYNTVYDLR